MLPPFFERALFRDSGLLFGWNLGDRLSSFTAPPWLTPPTRDGEASGKLEGSNYNDIRVQFRLGRLVRVEALFDLNETEAGDTATCITPYARAAAAALTARGLKGALKEKPGSFGSKRFEAKYAVAGEAPGTLTLDARVIDTGGDPLPRVEFTLAIRDGVVLQPDEGSAFIAASELAAVVASAKHPAKACEEVFERFFRHPSPHVAAQSPEAPLVKRFYAALRKLEAGEVRRRTHALLKLVDWTRRNGDQDAVAHSLFGTHLDEGGWLKVGPTHRLHAVRGISKAKEGLADAAVRLSDALDFDDDAAFGKLHAALARRPERSISGNLGELEWLPAGTLGDKLFALTTAGMSVTDVARFTARHMADRAAPGVHQLSNLPGAPTLPAFEGSLITDTLKSRANPHAWANDLLAAQFLTLVKGLAPDLFLELSQTLLEQSEGLCVLLADERAVSIKERRGVYRLGARVVLFSVVRDRSRTEVTDHPDVETARRAFARAAGKKKR